MAGHTERQGASKRRYLRYSGDATLLDDDMKFEGESDKLLYQIRPRAADVANQMTLNSKCHQAHCLAISCIPPLPLLRDYVPTQAIVHFTKLEEDLLRVTELFLYVLHCQCTPAPSNTGSQGIGIRKNAPRSPCSMCSSVAQTIRQTITALHDTLVNL